MFRRMRETKNVHIRIGLFLALLNTNSAAAASPFLLGADYSELTAPFISAMATDSSGALYLASVCEKEGPPALNSCVTKLSADGKTILWRNNLGFALPLTRKILAVDTNGGVYVAAYDISDHSSVFIAKLSPTGTGLMWKTKVASGGSLAPRSLTVDSQGRTYVAGSTGPDYLAGEVIRLNATGSKIDYTTAVSGAVASIAVDASGGAFLVGDTQSGAFLARLEPDGSAGFFESLPGASRAGTVAIDPNGNAVALSSGVDYSLLLQCTNATGAITHSSIAQNGTPTQGPGNLIVDPAGNAYITATSEISGYGYAYLSTARNSLNTCGSGNSTGSWLKVFAPDGALLQATYLPQTAAERISSEQAPLIAAGRDSTIFLAQSAGANFVPSQASPFPQATLEPSAVPSFLLRLSPNAKAQIFPLACLGSAASYTTGPIAPGGLVTLFGMGLGPQQGANSLATPQSPFPTNSAGVVVTFDGTPAPLLYVQDSQINAVAPWSLAPGRTTQVCVTYNSVMTNCLTWPVTETSLSVFTTVLNQDGSVNSAENRAPEGSIVSLFATGLGPIDPPQADGALVGFPLPINKLKAQVYSFSMVSKFVSSHQFEVTYTGPAPYLVAGVSQINVKLTNVYGDAQLFVAPLSSSTVTFVSFTVHAAVP